MLITMQNLQKSFGANVILKNINAVINKDDRIGLIGENGTGKTTLLKVLCGEYLPDKGEFSMAHNITLGYLEQNTRLSPQLTVWGEMKNAFSKVLSAMTEMREIEKLMAQNIHSQQQLERHDYLSAVIESADGYNMDVQIKKILSGMAFEPDTYDKKIEVLSGGEHTRLCLARLLLSHPDVLVLDEPTNHLDFKTMEWLENYLKVYSGAVLVVSHDRYFLDAICNRIYELEDGEITAYKGNYSAFLPQKEAVVALLQKQHDADIEKVKKLEDYIARNLVRASTTKMAQSRRKVLEKMEITEKPKIHTQNLKFKFEYDIEPYLELLTIKNLSVSAGGKALIKSLDTQVKRGERLVIAGPNGAGKSTLLRVLSGKLRPGGGIVRLGMGARVSVFEQQQGRRGGTVENAIWNKYPKMTELEVRSHLARFNFKGEDVYKPCEGLSGGELARLRFAEIVLEKPNLLFLDEPTNHLDIYMRESLSAALDAFEGTLLLVTHDRYLMNSLGCRILYIDGGECVMFDSYSQMINADAQLQQAEKQIQTAPKPSFGKEQRRRKAELRTKVKQLEDELEILGADIVEIENLLGKPEIVCDHEKVIELCDKLSDAKFNQNECYNKWSEAFEELDALTDDTD